MSIFRPTYKSETGERKKISKWWIEVTDHNQIKRRFAGFADKSQTKILEDKIKKLIVHRLNHEPPDRDLTEWLGQIPQALQDKFVTFGLVDAKRAAAGSPLDKHLEDFRQSLLAKDSTVKHAEQTAARARQVIEGCDFDRWSDISASRVEQHLADLRNNGSHLSAQTSNFYLKAVKQFCRWMVRDKRAIESPLEYLKGLNVRLDRRHDRRTLEIDEVRRLLQAAESGPTLLGMTGPERSMLYRLAIETGARENELRTAKVSAFNLDNCTLTVEAAYSKHRREDVLMLRPDTAAELKRFLAGKLSAALAFNVHSKTVGALKADLANAGIPYVKDGLYADVHALRHTCASLLAAAGVQPKVLQKIMRHSDINLTMSYYTHTLTGQESEAVQKLPDFSVQSKEIKKVS